MKRGKYLTKYRKAKLKLFTLAYMTVSLIFTLAFLANVKSVSVGDSLITILKLFVR